MEQKMYTCIDQNGTLIVSIASGCEIVAALERLCSDLDLQAGEITGLGAISGATLRFFDPRVKHYVDKTFEEQMEIANLTGNISRSGGKPYLHVHACLGRADYTMIGGHLLRAVVRGACELFVRPMPGPVGRRFDPETGLNLYEF